MIVILHEMVDQNHSVTEGCTFIMTGEGGEKLIEEVITKPCVINYACSFVFMSEDLDNPYTPNIGGWFGDKDNLPDEIKEAKHISELSINAARYLCDQYNIKYTIQGETMSDTPKKNPIGRRLEVSYAMYRAYNRTSCRAEAVQIMLSSRYEEAEATLSSMWDAIDATMDMENTEGPMGG